MNRSCYDKSDPDTIRALFNSIAENYDKTNNALSFGMHKQWNRALIDQAIIPAHPKVLLDLCCGTGAIAFEYLQRPLNASWATHVYMLDFSDQMLAYAKRRGQALQLPENMITYLQADAQQIPLTDASIACATVAYGIRNVKRPEKCIEEVYRVLVPGGTFGILELTQPKNPLLRLGHRLYTKTMLPLLGKLMTSNEAAYQYLCTSINAFIPPEDLERLMQTQGFHNIQIQSFLGGAATLLIGKK